MLLRRPGLELSLRFRMRLLAAMRLLIRRKRRARLGVRRLVAARALRGKVFRFLLGLGWEATLGRLFRRELRLGQRWRRCAAARFRGGLGLGGSGGLAAHSGAELGKETLLRGGWSFACGTGPLRGGMTAFTVRLGLAWRMGAVLGLRGRA